MLENKIHEHKIEEKRQKNHINPFKVLGLLLISTIISYPLIMKPAFDQWGATKDEVKMLLPGDNIISFSQIKTTRAITINTSPEKVYPWLVQMGKNKGGFYSYDWLENIFGLKIHSTESINEKWQEPRLGDILVLAPMGGPRLIDIKKNQYLVFGGNNKGFKNTWSFNLLSKEKNKTRLIIRSKNQYDDKFSNFVMWQVLTEPVHFLMEEKMMRGIKQRAESLESIY